MDEGNNDKTFGLCLDSSFLYYKVSKIKRVNFSPQKDINYNIL